MMPKLVVTMPASVSRAAAEEMRHRLQDWISDPEAPPVCYLQGTTITEVEPDSEVIIVHGDTLVRVNRLPTVDALAEAIQLALNADGAPYRPRDEADYLSLARHMLGTLSERRGP